MIYFMVLFCKLSLLRNDIEITRLSWFQSRKYQDTADLEGIQGPDWYPFGVMSRAPDLFDD